LDLTFLKGEDFKKLYLLKEDWDFHRTGDVMLIIGERINTSRKPVNEAVAKRNAAYIQADVKSQLESGADLIDVNAGSRHASEIDDLLWLIEVIQQAFPQARLCLDSPAPESLKAVLGHVTHPPMLNSTTGEKTRFQVMAPIIRSRDCEVVALCIDDRGIPTSVDQTLENGARLISDLEALGVKRERIYIDPVIQAVSTNPKAALMVLETIEQGRRQFEGVHFICGLSNISFGLPKRSLLNRTFLALAMKAGLDSAIIDPLDKDLLGTLRATAVLTGQDPWCQAYTRAFREGKL
jgi:5-methyltetrahydrofolate--homocysteine methyltransferase